MMRASPAAGRGLSASLEQLKTAASSANGQDVQLRALEGGGHKPQPRLLDPISRNIARPTPARTSTQRRRMAGSFSRASVSHTPAYPKKLPIVLIATFATLMLSVGAIVTG